MRWGKLSDTTYLLRLEQNEEILSSIALFCDKNAIVNASIVGLGSLENPVLAHYNVTPKKYSEKSHEGVFEISNLTGTVGKNGNKALIHLHVTISDDTMQAFGGHLVKASVSATAEIVLTAYPSEFTKLHNETIGLKLFNLPNTS